MTIVSSVVKTPDCIPLDFGINQHLHLAIPFSLSISWVCQEFGNLSTSDVSSSSSWGTVKDQLYTASKQLGTIGNSFSNGNGIDKTYVLSMGNGY